MRGDRAFVLFLPACEGVGHAGRMLLVAQALREQFDGIIEFAGDGPSGRLFSDAGFRFHEVGGGFSLNNLGSLIATRPFSRPVAAFNELIESYHRIIDREVELYRSLTPDLLVWDGRFIVPVSAELAGLPFVSVLWTYLTPYSTIRWPLPGTAPQLRIVARCPVMIRDGLAALFQKKLFPWLLLKFFNALRVKCHLAPRWSVDELFESLQPVILPEPEALAPTRDLPKKFHHVGFLAWQPQMEVPGWLTDMRDLVYITMGTSGNPRIFRPLIEAFAERPAQPVVITTGDLLEIGALAPLPGNVHVHRFLPGLEVAKRARVMICQGAPATMAQALSQGVPVIGIPAIFPQEIALEGIVRAGAGLRMDAHELTPATVIRATEEILGNERYRMNAKKLSAQFELEGGPRAAATIIVNELRERRPWRR